VYKLVVMINDVDMILNID